MSVVVPVYNAEKYLVTCLDSLLKQSDQDIEIICINDGSSDDSANILNRYVAQDTRLVLIENKRNMGAAYSRNEAIKKCRGKYVMFVDSDDFLSPDAIEKVISYCDFHNLDMCFYKFIIEANDKTKTVSDGISGEYSSVYSGEDLLEQFSKNREFFLYMCSACYRRHFLQDNNLFITNLIIGEGGDFILRSLIKSRTAGVLNNRIYHYRIHNASVNNREDAAIEALWGRFIQLSNVFRILAERKESRQILSFLEYYQKKVAGGLKLLGPNEISRFIYRCRDDAERYFLRSLCSYDVYGIEIGQEIIDKCEAFSYVYVYGLGYATEEVLSKLSEKNIVVEGVIVSQYKSSKKVYMGHRILRVDDEELKYKKKDLMVIVAAHNRHKKAIFDSCRWNGFENIFFLDIDF